MLQVPDSAWPLSCRGARIAISIIQYRVQGQRTWKWVLMVLGAARSSSAWMPCESSPPSGLLAGAGEQETSPHAPTPSAYSDTSLRLREPTQRNPVVSGR